MLNYSPQNSPLDGTLPSCSALCCCRDKGIYLIVDLLEAHSLAQRLEEMGFYQGGIVSLISPGNPAVVMLGNTRFALNQSAMEAIIVQKLS